MKIVLDSNILISAFIKDSLVRKIIFDSGFKFYHPKKSLDNLNKYKELILTKSEISTDDYDELYKIIFEKIVIVDEESYLDKLEEAKDIMSSIDIEDVPFIALALSIKDSIIWSEDKHFEKQDKIKIMKTDDMNNLVD